MDVVVDNGVAVLQVLAFGYAVGADHHVDFAGLMRHGQRLFFGAGCKQREHGLKVDTLTRIRGQPECGFGLGRAGDLAGVDAVFLEQVCRQVVVQVIGGVRKRGEYQ